MSPGSCSVAAAAAVLLLALPGMSHAEDLPDAGAIDTLVVTARLRAESAQDVPISMSVVTGDLLEDTLVNNLQQLAQLAPTLGYTSANPRNTAFTIRGLGSSVVAVSQANDGLEPGVGFYVDDVYHARPATAAFEFVDLERVELLRGPQGTLFGKNTTAGAISLRSLAPSFDPQGMAEASIGALGWQQARVSVTGPLAGDALAGRFSAITTRREGVLRNVRDGARLNDVDSVAVRGQLLWQANAGTSLRVTADYAAIDATCCTQAVLGVAPTLRPPARQYAALAAGQGYSPPGRSAYDRLTDIDASLAVDTAEGGIAAVVDWELGALQLKSVTAWRFWDWDAANDRDFLGLPIQLVQRIPSRQDQYSQELRLAGQARGGVEYVAGLYAFSQVVEGNPITTYGPLATYWLLGPAPQFPQGLLDGYGSNGRTRYASRSQAAFGEMTWKATARLSVTAGLRYTFEQNRGRFDNAVAGGATPATPAQSAAKLSILRPQSYDARVDDDSASGRVAFAFAATDDVNVYGSFARGFKSGGINMSGLPVGTDGLPALATAVIRPERVATAELGVKTQWLARRLTLNADVFHTTVRDFQATVVDSAPGALRGYLANVDRVRVRGVELDAALRTGEHASLQLALAYSDGRYLSYANGPCPIELTGTATSVCDLSGRRLAQLPRWAGSLGGEYVVPLAVVVGSEAFLRADLAVRSRVAGEGSGSRYTELPGFGVLNGSAGLRWRDGAWEAFVWARNLTDRDYLQNVTVQSGNSGLVLATPSDPRVVGATLRARF